jgi:hypothetical protein
MSTMTIVEEHNRDDMSRKAGCFLYTSTQLWLEDDKIHREDGPAVIFPDGTVRWYVNGEEITRDVTTFFLERKWAPRHGLDSQEKLAAFKTRFVA